jgi:hypothetical protein
MNNSPMNNTMQELLTGSAPATVVYTVGGSFPGWSNLRLDADGSYELRSTMAEDQQQHEFSGTVSPDRVSALIAQLRDERIWEVEHVKKRAPGETAARIEVTAGERSAAVELWTSEVRRVPAFQRATDVLVALIGELSGGVISEPGR